MYLASFLGLISRKFIADIKAGRVSESISQDYYCHY